MDGGGEAGGCVAGDVEEDVVFLGVGGEFGAYGGGVFIGDGEHGSALGFFHVGAEGRGVGVVFLDEVGDFPAGEEFFEFLELGEVEPAGDEEEAGCWDVFGVEDSGGHG